MSLPSDTRLLSIVCPESVVSDVIAPNKSAYFVNYDLLLTLTSESLDKQYTLICDKIKDEQLAKTEFCLEVEPLGSEFNKIFFSARSGTAICLVNFPESYIERLPSIEKFYIYSPGAAHSNFELVSNDYIGVKHTKKNLKAILNKTLPESEKMYIGHNIMLAGMDVSMSNTGIACIQDCESENSLLVGSFGTKPGENDFIRGQDAGNNLCPMLMRSKTGKKYLTNLKSCNHIAIEGGALNATHGAYRLGRYCGMLLANFNIQSITEIAPTSLKKYITGYGRSDKAVVTKYICQKFNVPESFIANDDESDALSLLYCQLNIADFRATRPIKKAKKRARAKKVAPAA